MERSSHHSGIRAYPTSPHSPLSKHIHSFSSCQGITYSTEKILWQVPNQDMQAEEPKDRIQMVAQARG